VLKSSAYFCNPSNFLRNHHFVYFQCIRSRRYWQQRINELFATCCHFCFIFLHDQRAMIASLQKGDEVITSGGIVGKISKVSEAFVSVEIAPNTEITVQKQAVQSALPKGTIKSL
jgi:preprotein translocase YajC subunit